MAFGSDAWDRLFGAPRPKNLHPFREIHGCHHAVATPGDILFHIRATRMDLCFEMAIEIMSRLRGAVSTTDEVHGSNYFDDRDLIGFVDADLKRHLAARRVVDVEGPKGAELSALGTGHLKQIQAPSDGIQAAQREAKPLVELRVPFELSRQEIDDVERGATRLVAGQRSRAQDRFRRRPRRIQRLRRGGDSGDP